jgi:hypothetical protein
VPGRHPGSAGGRSDGELELPEDGEVVVVETEPELGAASALRAEEAITPAYV